MDKDEVLAWLARRGTRRHVQAMARYGIRTADRVLGVPMETLLKLARQLGKDHALAAGLWGSGVYEARLLATLVDDPSRVTRRQMNAWAAAFDNWAVCDTACFHLFDRTPFAWEVARRWAASPREFVRRGGFALMASLALHDKAAPEERFLPFLPLIERGATDERNFVKKAVSWALRAIGRRRTLHARATHVAKRLAQSDEPACRRVGKAALRDLSKMRAPRARRRR
jgi:3-methyladenine DNA glycosylase AlkD